MRKASKKKGDIPASEELNLVEFPLALLADKVPDGLKTLEFSDRIRDSSTAKEIERQVIITSSEKWGLPNWQDQDVLLALMVLSFRQHNFKQRTVEFSLYELRKLLAYPHDGRYNRRLQLSLDRWCGITIKYENAWRTADRWSSKTFHVIDNVTLARGRDFDPQEVQCFKWNDVVVESFQNSHTKPFDWDFYRSLQSPTAKRLYRFLDKRFWQRRKWDFNGVDLAVEKLGLMRGQKAYRYKDRLKKAVRELEDRGFLKSLTDQKRFVREGKGGFRVHLEKAPTPKKPEHERRSDSAIEQLLIDRGVEPGSGPTGAKAIARACDRTLIEDNCERFDLLIKAGRQIGVGLLISQIQKGQLLRLPTGAKTRAELRADAKRAIAKQSRKRVAQELERQRTEAQRQALHLEREAFRTFISHLSEQERHAVETEILQRARDAGQGWAADQVGRRRVSEPLEKAGPMRIGLWKEYGPFCYGERESN